MNCPYAILASLRGVPSKARGDSLFVIARSPEQSEGRRGNLTGGWQCEQGADCFIRLRRTRNDGKKGPALPSLRGVPSKARGDSLFVIARSPEQSEGRRGNLSRLYCNKRQIASPACGGLALTAITPLRMPIRASSIGGRLEHPLQPCPGLAEGEHTGSPLHHLPPIFDLCIYYRTSLIPS